MAFIICMGGRSEELWEWIQKAKARSLSDALGLGVLMPEALKLQILGNQETKTLLEEEKKLLNVISNSTDHARISLRADLWTMQKQMKEHESLRELIGLREGHSIRLDKIRKLLPVEEKELSPGCLVFVDWFLKDMRFHVCILKDQGPPQIRQCMLERRDVVSWRAKYLNSEEGRTKSIRMPDDEDNPLRQLDPLVAPLKGIAQEGDTFVFSVTDVIHSLPVHALWLDGEPIVDSHPVVYSASLTSFSQCWARAAARKGQLESRTILAVFEKSEGKLKETLLTQERTEMYQAAEQLSREAGVAHFLGQEASRQVLTSALQSSSVVHFIGHCILNKSAITDQALVLGDGEFTVRDILNVKLTALLIILIACNSASQAIAPGDEPLGIVSALLCGRASSVLSTI
jgi:CHAT domain-containing protein